MNKDSEIDLLGGYVGPNPVRFLEKKIESATETLVKLNEVTPQHALLLLRLSIQHKLRHLQRTLPATEEILNAFKNLDQLLLKTVLKLRGSRNTEETFDSRIITLPVKLGGLGILSHSVIAPHARQASIEQSDSIIQKIRLSRHSLRNFTEPTLTSQRERTKPVIQKQHDELIADLPPAARIAFMDNHSLVSSQWLHTIPYNRFSQITGSEVAVGLSYRTLVPGHNPVCRDCALPNTLGHDEVCTKRIILRTARHEGVKKAISYHLKTDPRNEITTEPHVPGRLDRTDIRIIGPASYQQASSDYDVKVTALLSQGLPDSISTSPIDSPTDDTIRVINGHLDKIAAEKIKRYAHNVNGAFHPIIFSSAGTPSKSTQKVLSHWKEVLPRSTYDSLLINIGIGLLRSRARLFHL